MIIKRGAQINDTTRNLHVTVTIDGVDYPFNHVCRLDETDTEIQAREPAFKFDILRDLYPDAPATAKVSLEAMEQWILDGCWTDEGTQAEKKPWTQAHPSDLMDKDEEASLKAKIVALLSSLSYADIDSKVDTIFPSLTAAQRMFLKIQAGCVLYLVRKKGFNSGG